MWFDVLSGCDLVVYRAIIIKTPAQFNVEPVMNNTTYLAGSNSFLYKSMGKLAGKISALDSDAWR